MRIKIFMFVVSFSLLSNLNSVSLNAAETTFDFKRYELVLSNVTWDQARTAAQAAGGDLLVIETEAENTHIFNWLQTQLTSIRSATSGISNAGGAYYVWLGASDADEEGSWTWVNGVKFYDGTGASGSAEARIQEQTPALKLQTNKTDLEKKLQSIQSRTNQLSRRGIQQYRIQEQFGNFAFLHM